MVFLECAPCEIVWEGITRQVYKNIFKADISRGTKRRRSAKILSRVPAVLAGS